VSDLSRSHSQTIAALDARMTQYERRIAAALRDALAEVRTILAKMYEDYAVDGVLSKAQMTQYNRLTTLERQLTLAVGGATDDVVQLLNRIPPEAYEESFFRHAWVIDNGAGVRLTWGTIDTRAVAADLRNKYAAASLDDLGKYGRTHIREVLDRGLTRGLSYEQMARQLKDAINSTAGRAMRILRTEGPYAINRGASDAYARAQEEGVNLKVIWDATLDAATRPSHGVMDGQARGDDGNFDGPGFNRVPVPAHTTLPPEERCNCRCNIRPEIEGYEPIVRRTRDEGVIPWVSYDTWRYG